MAEKESKDSSDMEEDDPKPAEKTDDGRKSKNPYEKKK